MTTSARPERFELSTFGSVDRRSIQLSYGRPRASYHDRELRDEPFAEGNAVFRSGPLVYAARYEIVAGRWGYSDSRALARAEKSGEVAHYGHFGS
jgi:hypothetical protein